jgi:hypothetical protein
MSQYLEISIDLTELGNGSFEIKARSPAGQASAPFKPPFTLADIGPMLVVGGLRRGGVSSDGDETRAAIGSRGDIGVSLYQSLFQGAIAGILARTEGLAANRSDGGIRIRMNFNLLEGGTAAVAALPWELMRKPGETDPLLVSTQTVLVRSLDVNKVVTPRPITGPLRVLLIRANPKGTAALDLSREGELIGRSLSELPGVMVDEVDPVEDKIFSQLANAAYHVVHYMGHGDFAATKGGMLLLEDDAGNAMPTSAKAFAHLLRDEPLRLVFLNACDTGTTPQTDGLHPFAGVAAALVANGVPAVVAMQFPITDRAALTFSKVFYERIAAGDAVDLAVAQGRSALYLAAIRAGGDDDAGEWATPVLYMRAEDGAVLGGRAVATPLAASGSSAQTTRTHGLWNQHSALTWVLLGIVVAFIAFVALVVFSPDAEAPPAAAEMAAVDPDQDFNNTLVKAKRSLQLMSDKAFINDGFVTQAYSDITRVGVDLNDAVPDLKNDFALRAKILDALTKDQDQRVAGRAAYIYANQLKFDEEGGGEKNAKEILANYLKAAGGENGVPAAMAHLVVIYLEGQGTDVSVERAQHWLGEARAACNWWRLVDPSDPRLKDPWLPDTCEERPAPSQTDTATPPPDVMGGPGEQPSLGEVVTE